MIGGRLDRRSVRVFLDDRSRRRCGIRDRDRELASVSHEPNGLVEVPQLDAAGADVDRDCVLAHVVHVLVWDHALSVSTEEADVVALAIRRRYVQIPADDLKRVSMTVGERDALGAWDRQVGDSSWGLLSHQGVLQGNEVFPCTRAHKVEGVPSSNRNCLARAAHEVVYLSLVCSLVEVVLDLSEECLEVFDRVYSPPDLLDGMV